MPARAKPIRGGAPSSRTLKTGSGTVTNSQPRLGTRISGHLACGLLAVSAVMAVMATPAARAQGLSLRDAAERALHDNPDLRARGHAHAAATEATQAARSGFLPRVGASVATGYGGSSTADQPTQRVGHLGADLTLTQRLWDGHATRLEVERAMHEQRSRGHEWHDTVDRVLLEVAEAYAALVRYSEFVALAQANREHHRQAFEKLDARLKAGAGRGVDVEQARARLLAAQAAIAQEEAGLRDAALRFERVVGQPPGTGPWQLPGLAEGLPADLAEAARRAQDDSPAIAAAIEEIRAARAVFAQRKADAQPKVEARLRAGGGHNYSGVDGRRYDVAAQLAVSWTLYDGGERSSREAQHGHLLSQAMDQRDRLCRQSRQDIAQAYNEMRRLHQQIVHLQDQVVSIEKASQTYQAQFDVGQRSVLDLLNAQVEVHGARRNLASSRIDLVMAQARAQAVLSRLGVVLGLQAPPAQARLQLDGAGDGCPGTALVPAQVSAPARAASPVAAQVPLPAPATEPARQLSAPPEPRPKAAPLAWDQRVAQWANAVSPRDFTPDRLRERVARWLDQASRGGDRKTVEESGH